MIASLHGTVELRDDTHIIVNINGVGYKVTVPTTVFSSHPIGAPIILYTHTHVREDQLELYGFLNSSDLGLFQALLSVSGIGPKTAIGAFSIGTGNEIRNAILEGNVAYFTSIPRLGKKNAQKIIIELRSKLGNKEELSLADGEDNSELITALRSFGFTTAEAHSAMKNINGEAQTLSEKVKLALKYLGK